MPFQGWSHYAHLKKVSTLQKFVGAAVRATRVTGNPVRIFVAIVRNGLWHHITAEQEGRAVEVLKHYSDRAAGGRTTKPEKSKRKLTKVLDGLLQVMPDVPSSWRVYVEG